MLEELDSQGREAGMSINTQKTKTLNQKKLVWAISKHLKPISSATVENSLRNRHLNLKSDNFKMLGNCNFKFFQEKSHFLIMYVNQWL